MILYWDIGFGDLDVWGGERFIVFFVVFFFFGGDESGGGVVLLEGGIVCLVWGY